MWEPLKRFRGHYDNERYLSESILEAKQIVDKKKELDKLILNAIRLCIVNDEHDKVFTYLDLLNFTQSLKLSVKLCNSLQQNTLAQKISQFITEREEKEVLEKQYQRNQP